jgi:hypothetical protein
MNTPTKDKTGKKTVELSNDKVSPSDLSAADLIKYLNGRKYWHGNQYRSLCGDWLRKDQIKQTKIYQAQAALTTSLT